MFAPTGLCTFTILPNCPGGFVELTAKAQAPSNKPRNKPLSHWLATNFHPPTLTIRENAIATDKSEPPSFMVWNGTLPMCGGGVEFKGAG